MSRTNSSLSKQLVAVSALTFGLSCVAVADESSMNQSSGDSSQNRGNMIAQSPCPQATEAAGMQQKKDEQKMESKTLSVNRRTPVIYPYVQPYFQQYPGQ